LASQLEGQGELLVGFRRQFLDGVSDRMDVNDATSTIKTPPAVIHSNILRFFDPLRPKEISIGRSGMGMNPIDCQRLQRRFFTPASPATVSQVGRSGNREPIRLRSSSRIVPLIGPGLD
jgi:hypothetical protein